MTAGVRVGSSNVVSMGGLDLLVCMQIQRNRGSETPGGHLDVCDAH